MSTFLHKSIKTVPVLKTKTKIQMFEAAEVSILCIIYQHSIYTLNGLFGKSRIDFKLFLKVKSDLEI